MYNGIPYVHILNKHGMVCLLCTHSHICKTDPKSQALSHHLATGYTLDVFDTDLLGLALHK